MSNGTVNSVSLVGNVGDDPRINELPSGSKVANISLATREEWKDKKSGERVGETTWHRCEIYGPLVDIAEKYVHKGDKLFLQGQIKVDNWKDKETGADRTASKIKVRQMEMLSSKGSGNKPSSGEFRKAPVADESDLPF